MKAFDHEKLDVYGLSINFVAQANAIMRRCLRPMESLGPWNRFLRHTDRASTQRLTTSAVRNLAQKVKSEKSIG